MLSTLIVTFDGEAFYPDSPLTLAPNKRYQIQILREEQPLFSSDKEVEQFFDEAHQAFAALRNDPQAWQEELAERQLWDSTLLEGDPS